MFDIIGLVLEHNPRKILVSHGLCAWLEQRMLTRILLQHRENLAAEDSYKRLLESLYFPDINARQEGIAEAHKKTFEWIFDKPGNGVRPWHNFMDWLEHGHSTYWISGKVGSGKSTLMSFVCQDPRTEAALKSWSGTSETFMPTFFFWDPGTQLQKSMLGLLRSLIYQIMDRFPKLMTVILSSLGLAQRRLQQLPTWTENRLRTTLERLLSDGLATHRLCLFIDGLDEFHGDPTALLDLIRKLGKSTNVKFCVSSRPYQSFGDELGSSAMLKLHDLTEPDIRTYVSDELTRAFLKISEVPYPSPKLDDTVDTIVEKAEGVFLWVKLAVRDQVEGIRSRDNAEQLKERLKILPNEIEGLYEHMLQMIHKVHRKEVAQYLQLVLHPESWSLFAFALALHERMDDFLILSPQIPLSDIRDHCKSTKIRIAMTCRGFLEVREDIDLHEWQIIWQKWLATPINNKSSGFLEDRNMPLEQRDELIETDFFSRSAHVHLLHRTALEFFNDNGQGKEFLKANLSENLHPSVLYVKSELANLRIFPTPAENHGYFQANIMEIMNLARYAEEKTGVAQPALMDVLDRTVAMLYQQQRGQLTALHWSKAWTYARNDYDHSHPSYSLLPPFRSPTTCAVDFPGFAAYSGLRMFVAHTLDSQGGWQDTSTVNYLLSCVLDGFNREMSFDSEHLALIPMLLKRGADPNMSTSNGSAWGSFLRKLHDICYRGGLRSVSSGNTEWGMAVRAFLESGANVNERTLSSAEQYWAHNVLSTPLKIERSSIIVHLSALSVLRQCFINGPNYSDIIDTCIASGATLYSECIGLVFKIRDERYDESWIYTNLSKQQLTHVTDIVEQCFSKAHAEYSEELDELLHSKIAELLQELDIEKLYEQACRESTLEGQFIQIEESQEDESSNEVRSISDESSIGGSDSDSPQVEGPSHSAHVLEVQIDQSDPNTTIE